MQDALDPFFTAPRGGSAKADAVRLVLRTVESGAHPLSFLARRAASTIAALPPGQERVILECIVSSEPLDDRSFDDPLRTGPGQVHDMTRLDAVLRWACHLEADGRLVESAQIYETASAMVPGDPVLILHAARLARKCGDGGRAEVLYRRVAELARSDGRLARLAAVGRALMSPDGERRLGRILRAGLRAADQESAAVAQEARGTLRRRAGDRAGAVRDYLIAALRYANPTDMGRLGHELADLFVSERDFDAARRILLETESRGNESQATWARGRLRQLAVAMGDEVGGRRWADAPTPCLTTLMPPARSRAVADGSFLAWSERLERSLQRLGTSSAVRRA